MNQYHCTQFSTEGTSVFFVSELITGLFFPINSESNSYFLRNS